MSDDDSEHLEQSVADFCVEFAQIQKRINTIAAERKQLNIRQKELHTKILAIMQNAELHEIAMADAKIIRAERKTTTPLKPIEVCNLVISQLGDTEISRQLVEDINGLRVTTRKDILKMK